MGRDAEVTEEQWRERLTPAQYEVLRRAGTEPPGSGEYVYNKSDGTYRCAGCGETLFSSG
ncbi:MAG: peptide-methionine (R)-S-oxide reductase, partial [Acidimicrobiia bacterium]